MPNMNNRTNHIRIRTLDHLGLMSDMMGEQSVKQTTVISIQKEGHRDITDKVNIFESVYCLWAITNNLPNITRVK